MMDLRLVAKLVTSEGLTSRGSLGQLVDDSRLQASFEGDCTIYQRPNGQKERWKQDREPIGNGRYGSVFLQRRVDSARYGPQVRAVKIVDVRNHKGSEKPYEKELELIAKFSQSKYRDSFVQSYGWYRSEKWLYIAMEFCEYGDLKHYLEEKRRIHEDEAADIAGQVLAGLKHMHGSMIAHRDLKPANILIVEKPPEHHWWIKIADFGISKALQQDGSSNSQTAKGSPAFMAPEVRGFPCDGDPRTADPLPADMWALGETIFRAITGEPTFGKLQDLCSYQQSRIGFPVEALTALDVEEDATNFICSLMKSKPYQRLDVFRASKHVWLLKDKKETGPAQEYTTEVKEQDYGMNTLKAGQGGDLTGTATMVARSQGRMPTQSLPSTPALQEYPRGDRTRDKGKAPKTSPADPIQPPLETFRINSLEPATKKRSRKLLWSDWSAWTRSNTDERYYRQRQDEDGNKQLQWAIVVD